MKLQELYEKILIGEPSDGKYVIAHQKYLWVLDGNTQVDEKTAAQLSQTLHITVNDGDTIYDIAHQLEEEGDIIVGYISNNSLYVNTLNYRHSSASKDLLDVLKQLGLDGVFIQSSNFYTGDSNYFFQSRNEFLTPLTKKSFYHGTSLNNLEGKIFKTGLRPTGKTNFANILHSDKVFLTLNIEKAEFHAFKSANVQDSFPVILGCTIPDVNKLVLDYDVAIQFYGREHDESIKLGYKEINKFATYSAFRSFIDKEEIKTIINQRHKGSRDYGSLNTKLGIFGYIGRIPTKFIHTIFVDSHALKVYMEYVEMTGETDLESFMGESGISIERAAAEWDEYTPSEFIDMLKTIRDEIEYSSNEDNTEDEWR